VGGIDEMAMKVKISISFAGAMPERLINYDFRLRGLKVFY